MKLKFSQIVQEDTKRVITMQKFSLVFFFF